MELLPGLAMEKKLKSKARVIFGIGLLLISAVVFFKFQIPQLLLMDLTWMVNPNQSNFISVDRARKTKNAIFLDTRNIEEYEISHIQNARWVGMDSNRILDLDLSNFDTIIYYCSIGYRSGELLSTMNSRHRSNSFNLKKGVFEWINKGNYIYQNDTPSLKIHPFSQNWGMLIRNKHYEKKQK